VRFAEPTGDIAFAPREHNIPTPNLRDELYLTPEAFNSKFKDSPIKRTKRRGYLRNVTVALGNSGDSAAIPDLIHALHDSEPLIRSHAAWALGQIGGRDVQKALEEAFQTETYADVRSELEHSLEIALPK
jgi:epoxyqueuosine reductase